MKKIMTTAFAGIFALALAGCCNCGKNCPPTPPPQQPPCPMMKGECPCKCKQGCPQMKGECPGKPGCEMKRDCKRGPRPEPKFHADFKKRMEAMKQLREKYPQEMMEIDVAIIAQEDKVDALAAKAGIEMPKRPADMRRLRVAFPKEMKELEANAQNMKPEEFRKAIRDLQEKLNK